MIALRAAQAELKMQQTAGPPGERAPIDCYEHLDMLFFAVKVPPKPKGPKCSICKSYVDKVVNPWQSTRM
jgi:hypothetical protein